MNGMSETFIVMGALQMSLGATLAASIGLVLLLLVVLTLGTLRAARRHRFESEKQAMRAEELEERMGELSRINAEATGGIKSLAEGLSQRQVDLARMVSERLDSASHRMSQSMDSNVRNTTDRLQQLHERLAVIDSAQKNITDLASQVTSLRDVLNNKQLRGAFGQGRMEAIVQDGLPKNAFAFQFTLSNRTRPDCAIFLPGDSKPLIVDAKFPLEAFTALRESKDDEGRKQSSQRLRHDVMKHVGDIASRYLIPGETQEMALMFVPSESVYAELHDSFDDIIQRAYRARIVIVSPSLLMLAIQVIQQIQKDSRMREAADCIRAEVGHLMGDLSRLRERVVNLEKHFGQANEDIRQIMISSDKIEKRATRIEEMEFSPNPAEPAPLVQAAFRPQLQAGE